MKKKDVLRNRRLSLNLSQTDIAAMIGVSNGSISNVENGQDVSYPILLAYEQALDKRIQALDERERRERKIIEMAFSVLDTTDDDDEAMTLDYILIEIGRLSVLLDKKKRQEKREKNGEF